MSLTRDTKAQSTLGTENPKVLSYTCGASCKLLALLIIGATTTARGGGDPTYNGVTMTQAGTAQAGSAECNSELWYLFNPATGSAYNISVPNSGTLSLRLQAESFNGTGAQLFGTPVQTGASTATPSLTINSVPAGGMTIAVLGHGYKDPPTNRSDTVIYETDEGAWSSNGQSKLVATLGNITMSWTLAGSDDVAMIMAAFEEVAGATYKDFSGTAAPAANTANADLNRYGNFGGTAVLASNTPTADLGRILPFSGTTALVSVAPNADLQRYSNFSGLASLITNLPDADLSVLIFKEFAGLAQLISDTANADLNRYAGFSGTSGLLVSVPNADLMRYADFTGVAILATNATNADLGRILPFAGTAALTSSLPTADLSRYGNFVGLAVLLSLLPDCDLELTGGSYKDFLGISALVSNTPDADLSRISNFAGIVALISEIPNGELNMSGDPKDAFKPGIIGDMGVAGFKAPNWTRSAAGIWSANPTQTESCSDIGMDTAAQWTPGTGWDVGVTTPGVATHVAGTGAYLTNTGGTAIAVNTWYKITGDMVVTAGILQVYAAGTFYNVPGTGALVCAIRSNTSAGTKPRVYGNAAFAGTVDNYSVKALTALNLFAVRNFGKQVAFAAALTMTAMLPGGVVARYSDISNYVYCWHDGTNLHLDTIIAGVATSKVNAAAAYGAGGIIEIRWTDANTAQAWYNGVQIGADQDVSTVPTGNWAGLFGVDTTVQLTSPTWS